MKPPDDAAPWLPFYMSWVHSRFFPGKTAHFVPEGIRIDGYVIPYFEQPESGRVSKEEHAFLEELRSGNLRAWGRIEKPTAEWTKLRPSLWKHIVPCGANARGPNVEIFDVMVGPRLRPPEARKGGRPSQRERILKHHAHLKRWGRVKSSKRAQAKFLATWFAAFYPDPEEQPVESRTIERWFSEPGIF